MTVLIQPVQHWYCPNCGLEDVTHEAQPHSRFHTCRKLRGLTAPMLRAGTQAKVTVQEREDYIGTEKVQTDPDGRPVQSIITERNNGQDVTVFAPTATITGGT
jgi:hypothetical protein